MGLPERVHMINALVMFFRGSRCAMVHHEQCFVLNAAQSGWPRKIQGRMAIELILIINDTSSNIYLLKFWKNYHKGFLCVTKASSHWPAPAAASPLFLPWIQQQLTCIYTHRGREIDGQIDWAKHTHTLHQYLGLVDFSEFVFLASSSLLAMRSVGGLVFWISFSVLFALPCVALASAIVPRNCVFDDIGFSVSISAYVVCFLGLWFQTSKLFFPLMEEFSVLAGSSELPRSRPWASGDHRPWRQWRRRRSRIAMVGWSRSRSWIPNTAWNRRRRRIILPIKQHNHGGHPNPAKPPPADPRRRPAAAAAPPLPGNAAGATPPPSSSSSWKPCHEVPNHLRWVPRTCPRFVVRWSLEVCLVHGAFTPSRWRRCPPMVEMVYRPAIPGVGRRPFRLITAVQWRKDCRYDAVVLNTFMVLVLGNFKWWWFWGHWFCEGGEVVVATVIKRCFCS